MTNIGTGQRARTFDFTGQTDLHVALDIVRAALDDEGLMLHQSNTPDRPYAVWFPESNTTRVIVPPTRIIPKVA